MSSIPLTQLAPKTFTRNPLFAAEDNGSTGFIAARQPARASVPEDFDPNAEPEVDRLQQAYDRAFAAGRAEAEAEYEATEKDTQHRIAALDSAFSKTAENDARELGQKLQQLVLALCEQAMAPFALDKEGLVRRIEAASSMLMRAQDERQIRLHPEDIALIQDIVPEGLVLLPDGSLERGTLRIETEDGGVEDGPATWRAALEEAVGAC